MIGLTMRILVIEDIAPEGISLLKQNGIEIVRPRSSDEHGLSQAVVGCQGILVRGVSGYVSDAVLAAEPGIKIVARHGVGLDAIDVEACRRRGVRVTNTPTANILPVAEHTVAMITAVTKNLRNCDIEARLGNFASRRTHYGLELDGKTLGVIGLGRIGQLVAGKMRHAFGMRVLGYDAFLPTDVSVEGVKRCAMQRVLRDADIVTLHVPLTPDTRHMISEPEFAGMKQGAYLVNCARGGVVDETALLGALTQGHLRGAALDVFSEEPLSTDNPLTRLDSVILTPHIAAHSDESNVRMAVEAAQGVVDVFAGREPVWGVV